MALWADAGVDPTAASGAWYRETGSGMGATLNAGIGMGAYVMTDRATWISFGNKQDYQIAVEGDEDMFNQYGVIPVNPAACPSVNVDAAQTFADWLVSDEGQDGHRSLQGGGPAAVLPQRAG
jgi:tungstate transport system substrate-binding protein